MLLIKNMLIIVMRNKFLMMNTLLNVFLLMKSTVLMIKMLLMSNMFDNEERIANE